MTFCHLCTSFVPYTAITHLFLRLILFQAYFWVHKVPQFVTPVSLHVLLLQLPVCLSVTFLSGNPTSMWQGEQGSFLGVHRPLASHRHVVPHLLPKPGGGRERWRRRRLSVPCSSFLLVLALPPRRPAALVLPPAHGAMPLPQMTHRLWEERQLSRADGFQLHQHHLQEETETACENYCKSYEVKHKLNWNESSFIAFKSCRVHKKWTWFFPCKNKCAHTTNNTLTVK